MFQRVAAILLLFVPAATYAQNKDLVALQRYVADVGESVKGLQKSMEDKMAALIQKNADQGREFSDRNAQALTALGDRLQKNFADQQDVQTRTVNSLAALNAGQKQMATDLGDLKEAMMALTTAVNKLTTKMGDLDQSIRSINMPKPVEGPQMPAGAMINTAAGDYLGGKLDLALEGYRNFMKWYPTDVQAPDALYHIALIQYSLQQFDDAIQTVDQLLQMFPGSDKVPDALLTKAKSYSETSRWTEFGDVLSLLKKKYPTHSATQQASSIKPPGK